MKRYCPLASSIFLLLAPLVAHSAEKSVFDMSLEELMAQEVSTSRRAEEQFRLPAAIYIISREDIRRSGATSIADLLRLVPGMHVGQLSGNMFAINSRGTNRRYSRELLVMIDGRTVFNQLHNGVYWARVDTLLADIERIEVIRGPGGSLWGSNAAQGVVNIITRHPEETVGLYGEGTAGIGGSFKQSVAARAGFGNNGLAGRLYAKGKRLAASSYPDSGEQSSPGTFSAGAPAHDGHNLDQGGFRSSWQQGSHQLNLQGDLFESREDIGRISFGSVNNDVEIGRGGNLLLSHTYSFSDRSQTSFQAYYDYSYLGYSSFEDRRHTYDLDLQHSWQLTNHQLIWGLGYRRLDDKSRALTNGFSLNPASRHDNTYSAFIQDEFAVTDSLKVTLGSKYEHNDYTGSEWQPSGQLLYEFNAEQLCWFSASRAVIVPSRAQADGILDFGWLVIPINEPGAKANLIYSAEGATVFESQSSYCLITPSSGMTIKIAIQILNI